MAPSDIPLAIEIAVAKLSKYAVRESGDTVEVTERPHGGISAVLADGQGSGRSAKTISNMVAKKAISLLADGARDGATARAVSDYLFAYRHGQVSAELAMVSADLLSRTLVVTRNSHCPALIVGERGELEVWDTPATAIGIYANTKPVIRELPVADGTVVVAYSDGIFEAGMRRGSRFDPADALRALLAPGGAGPAARDVADTLLAEALAHDSGRAADDMSVVALCVRPAARTDGARRLSLELPL